MNFVDTRNFRRYKKDSVFQLNLGIGTYNCKNIEYSFQGICVHIQDDTFSLTPGDTVAFSMQEPEMDFHGEVLWINEAEGGQKVGFKRTGNLTGTCRDFRLSDILIGLQRTMKTGLLLIEEGNQLTTIYLRNGDYIFARSNKKDDRLGEFLLTRGKITLPQFFEASEILKKTGERLGNILVELGYLQMGELFSFIKQQVESVILNAFNTEFGTFEFREGNLPTEESVILKLSAANLIYRGVRNIMNTVNILEDLPPLESVLRISDNPVDAFQDISLDDMGQKILSLVKSHKTIEEILSTFPEDDYFEAVKALYALLCVRIIVTTADDTPHETIPDDIIEEPHQAVDAGFLAQVNELFNAYKTMNFYDILGLHGEATKEEIKKAYLKKAKQFHPDKHFNDQSEDIKKKLTHIFSHINSVYDILSHPDTRRRYDESFLKVPQEPVKEPDKTAPQEPVKAPEEADSKSAIARELFDKGRSEMKSVELYSQFGEEQAKELTAYLHRAIKLFFEAISFDNTRSEYYFHFGVALGRKKLYRESVTALNKAIELDSSNSHYFAELGYVLLNLGFDHRAKSAFGKALRISPSDARALEGINMMKER